MPGKPTWGAGVLTCPTEGNVDKEFVREGNKLNTGCALLCAIAHVIGVQYGLEQPLSSLFFHTPAMKACMSFTRW